MVGTMDIYAFLDDCTVPYQRVDHPPVYTVEQANRLVPRLPGAATKNLFLRDKKGQRHFLLVCGDEINLDLKKLANQLEISKLSLASPERLAHYLGVEPGAVSLLALVNDPEHRVELLVDRELWQADALQCHPLVNTATLVIPMAGIQAFFKATGHPVRLVEV